MLLWEVFMLVRWLWLCGELGQSTLLRVKFAWKFVSSLHKLSMKDLKNKKHRKIVSNLLFRNKYSRSNFGKCSLFNSQKFGKFNIICHYSELLPKFLTKNIEKKNLRIGRFIFVSPELAQTWTTEKRLFRKKIDCLLTWLSIIQ